MSPIPTKYKFKNFEKAINLIAQKKGLEIKKINKPGSARRFEVFRAGDEKTPINFWVNHESKFVHTKDMKKCLLPLGITEEELVEFLEKI